MSKKNINAIIKRDTIENWKLAKNYIPKENVIIIIDNPDGSCQLKIGDGETLVNNLQNILEKDIPQKSPSVDKEILSL